MDLVLLLAGLLFIIIGIIGSVLPVLPGPLAGWIGLLLLFLAKSIPMNYELLGITLGVALIIFVLDYIIPAIGARKFGGSKKGAQGATIGLIVGLILPIPFGFILGAFFGAFLGELIHQPKALKKALRSAFGSLIGFLASTTMKLFVSIIFLVIFAYEVIKNGEELFSF